MSFIDDLARRWISIRVPGTAPDERLPTTYVVYDQFPPAPAGVEDWAWLREGPVRDDGYMAAACEYAECDLSEESLRRVLGSDPPQDLQRFVAEPGLRRRMWSATDAYFDLGHMTQDVDGGRLLHLVSDSQWVMHWSMFVGDGGEHAVVASPFPTGFDLDEAEREGFGTERGWSVVCADTFAEFAWRWWMDNETFRRVELDRLPSTGSQRRFVAGYGEAQLLG